MSKEGQTHEDLKEGDVYDAVWNVNEESSPATVIKLREVKRKIYINTSIVGRTLFTSNNTK